MRLAPHCACGGGCPHCVGSNAGLDTDTALQVAQQAGTPLPNHVRSAFEPRFGIDLEAVRVHADAVAASAARGVEAHAYTVGSHIVFGAGRFAPETAGGQRLLAHELAHVVQQTGGTAPAIQREPETAAVPTSTPAAEAKAPPVPDVAVPEAAVKEAAKHPFITGLFSDIFKDLAYRKDFSLDEQKKLKLKGTESASYFALYHALVLPLGGTGGLQYGSDFGTNLSVFGKYLDALEPLTPSVSIKTDLASRILGLRVDEYLASDTFLKRLKDNAHTVTYLALVAQMGVSTAALASPASPDAGGLVDEPWNAHLLLVKTLIGLALKEKLKAPGLFDTGPLLTPTHPLYEKDTYFGGDLPSGLNIDAASGAKGGDKLQLGATVNLGKLAGGGTELDDPRTYRGWQGAVWGDYQRLRPTPELAERGRLPDARFRAGGLLGAGGLFVLGEVGGHFSGADADQLTSVFYSEGLAYVPSAGPLKKLGFKVTHINFEGGDTLAPVGTPSTGGGATRVTPFGAFQFELGGGGTLALGGSAGLTSSSAKPLDLSDWRGDISYTYLGKEGTADLPKFRIELSGSGSRVDYFDAKSPTLYGVRGKLQLDKTFVGAQVNAGAGKVPAARAEQALDPHTESPLPQIGGDSVLIVIGVLR